MSRKIALPFARIHYSFLPNELQVQLVKLFIDCLTSGEGESVDLAEVLERPGRCG